MNKTVKKACSMLMASIAAFSLITTVTFKNVIFAEETTGSVQKVTTEDISVTDGVEENTTVDMGDKETPTTNEEKVTENMENITTVETIENESTMPHKLTEEEMAEINHKNTQYGMKVTSGNLPWYVKLVVEETNIQPFQEALDNGDVEYAAEYYEDIDWEDEDIEDREPEQWDYDEDTEDDIDEADYDEENYEEDDIEDADELDDDSDWDEDLDDENEDDDYPQDKMVVAFKISFFDTKENRKYIIPENEKITLSIDTGNENYRVDDEAYHEYQLSMLKLLENGSVEILYKENNVYDEEYEYDEDEAENINETNADFSFGITESGEYGVALLSYLAENTSVSGKANGMDIDEKADVKSPKTGIQMKLLWGAETVSILLMGAAVANLLQRKREEK